MTKYIVAALLLSSKAFAGEPMIPAGVPPMKVSQEQTALASCQTPEADSGYEVLVLDGGAVQGLKLALVREVKKFSTDFSQAFVLKATEPTDHVVYSAEGFELKIQLESRAPTSLKQAELVLAGGQTEHLRCTLGGF